jgi:hypothetical protein
MVTVQVGVVGVMVLDRLVTRVQVPPSIHHKGTQPSPGAVTATRVGSHTVKVRASGKVGGFGSVVVWRMVIEDSGMVVDVGWACEVGGFSSTLHAPRNRVEMRRERRTT